MGLRMTMGGRKQDDSERYAEGYNNGFTHAMEEMRRRMLAHEPMEDAEEMRRRMMAHWPLENRQIGFIPYETEDRRRGRPRGEHEDMAEMMDMMRKLKESHESLKQGLASTVKKLDPRLVSLLETATSIAENPPSTWEPHIKRGDYLGIVKMEGKELMSALESHKSGKDMRKELSHTLAALMQLITQ